MNEGALVRDGLVEEQAKGSGTSFHSPSPRFADFGGDDADGADNDEEKRPKIRGI